MKCPYFQYAVRTTLFLFSPDSTHILISSVIWEERREQLKRLQAFLHDIISQPDKWIFVIKMQIGLIQYIMWYVSWGIPHGCVCICNVPHDEALAIATNPQRRIQSNAVIMRSNITFYPEHGTNMTPIQLTWVPWLCLRRLVLSLLLTHVVWQVFSNVIRLP